MKKNLILVLGLAGFFVAAVGMRPVPQDNPPAKKKNTHIKVVTVADGQKHVLDTVIEGNDLKVLHEGKGKNFTWTTVHATSLPDSMKEEFEVIKDDGKSNHVIIRKRGLNNGPLEIREMETVRDSGKNVIVRVVKSDTGSEDVFITEPDMRPMHRIVRIPFVPGVRMPYMKTARVRHLTGRNVIDLSDPGIISYQKKKLSGGREKITIIRNELKPVAEDTFDVRINDVINREVIGPDIRHAEKEIKVQGKSLGHPIDIEKK
jgi:hypothetical protein